MSDGSEALQRLYDDPAVVRAMDILREHSITGEQYDELVKQMPPIRHDAHCERDVAHGWHGCDCQGRRDAGVTDLP